MKTTQTIGAVTIARRTVLMGGADGAEIRTEASAVRDCGGHNEIIMGADLAALVASHPMTANEAATHERERNSLRRYTTRGEG